MVAYTIFTDSRYERYPLNSIKRSIKCLQHGMFVHFCMLAHVYVLSLTRLPISSIHFINELSYNRYICYQVLHTLFLSICMAVVDCTCIKYVSEYSNSKFIRLLLKNNLKFFIMVA